MKRNFNLDVKMVLSEESRLKNVECHWVKSKTF